MWTNIVRWYKTDIIILVYLNTKILRVVVLTPSWMLMNFKSLYHIS